ncbi:PadR family transcriptional regulator [Natronomonas gomsonensis]|uniref:PadR family transcriptional regulator n=1 Tax=Natronomonas gomsonensis TaxID=1046043 RepID=UPI0020CA35D7|nr:PadR family transcriptional regulator [Natronomonas gomsonensis]MCY4731143.1 PadR family transcriptional regulator [Natronomonas gomsonensis]
MTRMPELSDFKRDLLMTLARSEPTHGSGLVDDLSCLRAENVTKGRLYKNLDELHDHGLIEKRVRTENDNRRNEYALTTAGRESIRQHAQRVAGVADAINGGAA